MPKRYIITFTPEERQELTTLAKTRKTDSRSALFAKALLLCEPKPKGPGWKNNAICKALGMGVSTLDRLKKRFVEEGLSSALERKTLDPSQRNRKLDGAFEAQLIALACSPAPDGRSRWTVRLLAEKAVELELVDSVSAMSVQRVLKKTNFDLIRGSTEKSS
ncbi:MAG: helix-turn-helix domain-containing protein [Deltaproteobacteria bacterium]|jgi:transposase|nr:helix-turn-helix domain-containing protein [Deltaproteobacteria bacterium]